MVNEDNTHKLPKSIAKKSVIDLSISEMKFVLNIGLDDTQVKYLFIAFERLSNKLKSNLLKKYCDEEKA